VNVGPKAWAAGLAAIIALIGVVADLKWLTVIALVVWLLAMLYFGVGGRRIDQSEPPKS